MQTLEVILNNAIARQGMRMSPRISVGDRLTRFIQHYYSTQGRHLSTMEAEACAGLVSMKYRTPSRGYEQLTDFLSSLSPTHYKQHSMRLRSMA
jgi:hypothetical protein